RKKRRRTQGLDLLYPQKSALGGNWCKLCRRVKFPTIARTVVLLKRQRGGGSRSSLGLMTERSMISSCVIHVGYITAHRGLCALRSSGMESTASQKTTNPKSFRHNLLNNRIENGKCPKPTFPSQSHKLRSTDKRKILNLNRH